MPKKNQRSFLKENYLRYFAEAGNAEVLATMMTQTPGTSYDYYPRLRFPRLVSRDETEYTELVEQNKLGNTFLHTFAEKHTLKDLFKGIDKKHSEVDEQSESGSSSGSRSYQYSWEQRRKETTNHWLTECLEKQNNKGYTFLAVTVNRQDTETDVKETLKWMIEIFGKPIVSELCKKEEKGGNTLMHLAVQKSMIKLMDSILQETTDVDNKFNQDGYNPLHLAVQMKQTEMVRCILQKENFDVNIPMRNGETALHIAAQLGDFNTLGHLIDQGGDLAVRDEEDDHTQLHDCLQQVYFESNVTEEKCENFIRIWNQVVEKAVLWWCKKQKVEEPARGSEEYLELQRKAIYYLRSCVKNDDGLSVLQFAADRGLITCVQTMLSTKDVFVIQTKATGQMKGTKFEIDVTNLCPEYFISKNVLYSKKESKVLDTQKVNSKDSNTCEGKKIQGVTQNVEITDKKKDVELTDEEEDAELSQEKEQVEMIKENEDDEIPEEKEDDQTTTYKDEFHEKPARRKDKQNQENDPIISFLDALAAVKPPNKAGEILESIPMMSLTRLEWRVTQRIHILWMLVHIVLMTLATIDITSSGNDSTVWSLESTILGVFILTYTSLMITLHFGVKIMRRRPSRGQARRSVEKSIKMYEKDDEGMLDRLLSTPLLIFNETVFLLQLSFTGFAWAAFIPKILNLEVNGYVWIKGFFLLFGWLVLLSPLTSFSPIYKLISVLKYIVIRDMFPWVVIYLTISFGFATAIKLQFDELPSSSSCEDLTGTLDKTGHTLFELVVMTSGLDTDLKHVRSLSCLFENNTKSVYVILTLVTLYAMISAVVLLNMLIAIMSNTVTEAQQDKG